MGRFDPDVVQKYKLILPTVIEGYEEILEACHSVRSYDHYVLFRTDISRSEVETFIHDVDNGLDELKERGYDKHPELSVHVERADDLYSEYVRCYSDLLTEYRSDY